jgi:hypothetical protein
VANPFDAFDNPVTRGARDVGVAFSLGANGLVKMAGDLATLTTGKKTALSGLAQENIEYLQSQKSPELVAAEQEREAAVNAEENPVYQAWSYIKSTASNPLLAATTAAETAPSSVGAGALGAGARMAAGKLLAKKGSEFATKAGVATALGAGTAMQAADVGGDQFDELLKTLGGMDDDTAMQIPQVADLVQNKGSSIAEAKGAVALDLARKTAFGAGAVSAVSQLAPGGRTIERALVGGTKKAAGQTLGRTLLAGAKGAAGEATQESFEEAGGQVAKNILARPVEPERELTAGVGPAVGQAVMGAGALGGAAGIAQGTPSRPSPQPAPEGQTTAGKTGEAPASAATKNALAGAPEVALENSEGLTPEQFFAAVNIRQARLLGGEADPEDVRTAGEVPPPKTLIDPEEMRAAVDETQKALNDWKSQNPNAPENIVIVFDPEMLHNNYGIQGAFNPRDGSIFINSAFVAPENVGKIASHEWAHSTLATPEGQQAFADFVQREIPQTELDALATRYGTQDRRVLLEEWIAENQEKAPGVIERIVARIREWLAGVGIVDLSDAEAADIMLRTLRQQAEGRVQPDTGLVDGGAVAVDPNLEVYNTFIGERPESKMSLQKLPRAGDVVDANGKLKHTIRQKQIDVSHYSKIGGLTEIDPSFYGTGRGKPYHRMMKGINKSFFFVGNSKPNASENVSGAGMQRYRTSVDSSRIYDMDKDPLSLWFAANPEKSEGLLKELGYDGFFAKTDDNRSFVALFYPTNLETGEINRAASSEPEPELKVDEAALKRAEILYEREQARRLRRALQGKFSLTDRVAQGRDTVLAAEAQKLKRGETTPAKYARKVEQRMPLRPFDEVPEPATDEDILRGLGNRMAGETLKRELKANPEDIEGQQVEARLDIPSYEDANVWTVTLHNPRERAGAAGKVLAYTPTAVLRDVTFTVNETAAMNVAAGARKSSFATMDGTYVPATAQSAYDQAVEAKESGDWVEIGMNPIRHSYFYDKSDQRPVVSAEEVIQVGGLVLGRGVQYGEKSDQKFSLSEEPVGQAVEPQVEETEGKQEPGPAKKPLGEQALEDSKATKFKNQKGTAKYLGDLLKSEFPEGLDRMDPEAAEKLADLLDRELSLALTMPDNANAIGWYGREMEKVVEILRSPELNYELDNPVNRGVFNALLAITSNGQEVVDQFLKSAQLYEKWKKTGKIPSLGKWGGERNRAMAGQIKFLNQMLGLVGAEDTVGFLTSESSLREHLDNLYGMVAEARGLPEKATVAAKEAAIGKYLNAGMPTGELKDYNTVGAIVFGPKLGGGFFANLYGKFDRLTMDRWFMRTFHRLTGRLGFVDDRSIQGALDEARRDLGAVEYLVQTAAGVKKDAFDPVSKDRLSDSDLLAYIKSEGKKAFKNYREINAGLKENPEDASLLLQDTLRRTYNRIIKAESGLFDAPDNGSHRVFIRDVLNRVQQQRTQRGEKPIDTSDIQAILWYLEKDIWDKLKDKKEKAQDELDEQDEDDDDSAGRVSYSNGAVELYRRKTGKDYVFKSGNQPERAQVLASD